MFNTDRRIEIREVTTAEERERVYRFRYKVYVEEMKRLQQYADHDKKEICEPLDLSGHVLAAYDGGDQLIGTVRCNVIDMQRYFVRPEYTFGQVWGRLSPDDASKYFETIASTVVPNIKILLFRCRELAIPVYFTVFGSIREDGHDLPPWARQQNVLSQRLAGAAIYPSRSDPTWQIDDDVAPRPEEYVVVKTTSGPLSSTKFDVTLRARGIDSLVVVGVATNVCVTQAAREFADRVRVIVPCDACTTIGQQRHDAALETFAFIFGGVCPPTSVLSALSLTSTKKSFGARIEPPSEKELR